VVLKVLIGDNLASHFTMPVIHAATENDIRFVSLVPNSTHLLQPLDVVVFRSLKIQWKRILESWRSESRNRGAIPKKTSFKALLYRLQGQLKAENAIAGFSACGTFPPDRRQVLKRLPSCNKDSSTATANESEIFHGVVADMLQKHCSPEGTVKGRSKRGKKNHRRKTNIAK